MRERVLITGASGLLGASLGITLARNETNVLGIRRSNPRSLPFPEVVLNLHERSASVTLIREYRPTIIVHAAALSKVLECEAAPEEAHLHNVVATQILLEAAADVKAHVMYISTDQVFDGKKAEYCETDAPAATHVYGRTKQEAECLITAASKYHLILRSNNIVGRNSGWGKSFTDGLFERLDSGCSVELFHDQYRSPVHLSAIVAGIVECMRERVPGVLHVGGPQRLSRYETGLEFARAYAISSDLITPTSMMTYPHAATMHRDGSFCTDKLCALFPETGKFTIFEGFLRDAALTNS